MGKRLALLAGTFAAAWAHSKAVTTTFCWLWQESSVDGSPVCKPIWHVGNSAFVDATGAVAFVEAPQSVPLAPTMTINGSTATSGGSYGKNAELVITPATNAALYWRIGSGSWNVSDAAVTVTLPSGSLTIEAYCTNQLGNSQTASVSVTVAGTATPSFAAASGTTIDNNGVVSRGGSVVVSVPLGGELHYRINSGSWQTASGLSVSIPIATNLNQGQMVIDAYNVEDSEESTHLTQPYTMAALDAPEFSVADNTEFPATGGSVELTGDGDEIYYTTDGSTPTTSSTRYTGAISVNSAMTIKAIAHDNYGDSAVATATYRIKQAKMIITASEATTMDLGETGLDNLTINAGTTEFTPSSLGITSFADHTFTHLKFGDASKILTFDGGGAKFANLGESYGPTNWGAFMNASNLTSVKGIVIAGGCIANVFRSAMKLQELEISGTFSGTAFNAFYGIGWQVPAAVAAGCDAKILVSGTPTSLQSALSYCKIPTLTIAGLSTASGTSITSMFDYTTSITTLVCTTDTPPSIDANADWLAALVAKSTSVQIKVPVGSLSAYTSHSVWSNYTSRISELSNN